MPIEDPTLQSTLQHLLAQSAPTGAVSLDLIGHAIGTRAVSIADIDALFHRAGGRGQTDHWSFRGRPRHNAPPSCQRRPAPTPKSFTHQPAPLGRRLRSLRLISRRSPQRTCASPCHCRSTLEPDLRPAVAIAFQPPHTYSQAASPLPNPCIPSQDALNPPPNKGD